MALVGDAGTRESELAKLLEQLRVATPADIETRAVPGREWALASAPSSPTSIAALIDHTLLAPSADEKQIERTLLDAHTFGAATLCINSAWVDFAVRKAREKRLDVKVICTVGFPFGAGNTEAKALEAKVAMQQGAKEIDMVQNVGWLKSGHLVAVYEDIRAVCEAVQGTPVKVILETASLTKQETIDSAFIACLAGARFVKTSTGYGPGGATEGSVRLLKHAVDYHASLANSNSSAQSSVQVKASGGIRNLSTLKRMWECGADRVGASSTAAILSEAEGAPAEAVPKADY
ncbi:deoxyribose-phosphate aldolase [Ceraceosorus guamensis]|uniref:deoxyribose-phosphate aldolase n=1 Tax=Ceraceosorus guamensis TaxID=1522189 RepID=A0A316W7S2_9BASI|nr:deoxyribose-phosphate aldolase [Ceraceosorus guamensis]PWN45178.1 deoxyribose-phosphate aldolase [Ceraceosorus guamensis]